MFASAASKPNASITSTKQFKGKKKQTTVEIPGADNDSSAYLGTPNKDNTSTLPK
jgi:hypothetical protein